MFQVPSSKFQDKSGFTLIEVLVVISIILIAMSIAIVTGRNFDNSVDLENTVKSIDAKIKLAKSRSIGALDGTNHGVHFDNNQIVVFEGDTFIDGAPTNEILTLSDNIEIYNVNLAGGGSDLVFDRLIGSTDNYGSVSAMVINNPSKTKQIIINVDGQSSFNSFQTSLGPVIENARHVHFELGWNIENATILRLQWVDEFDVPIETNDIDTALYFNVGKNVFDWTGTTVVGGTDQKMRVHGWLDIGGNTVLCIVREQTENDKLNIYFIDGVAKDVATYENIGGVVNVTPGFYGGAMVIQ